MIMSVGPYPSHAFPVPVNSGTVRPGLGGLGGGILDVFGALTGGIVTGIFGSKEAKEQRAQEERLLAAQLEAAKYIARQQAQSELALANLAYSAAERGARASLLAQDAAARRQLQAIESQVQAAEYAQRQQRLAQSDALSVELTNQTQSGIFGLATESVEQTGSVLRSIPRMGTFGIVAIIAAIAITSMQFAKRPSRKGAKKRNRVAEPTDGSAGDRE